MRIGVGSGTSGSGGMMQVQSGRSTTASGGAVVVVGIADEQRSTRCVANAVRVAVLVFSTGSSKTGNSGAILIGTGAATAGRGGRDQPGRRQWHERRRGGARRAIWLVQGCHGGRGQRSWWRGLRRRVAVRRGCDSERRDGGRERTARVQQRDIEDGQQRGRARRVRGGDRGSRGLRLCRGRQRHEWRGGWTGDGVGAKHDRDGWVRLLAFSTGSAKGGNTGAILVGTGAATAGRGGRVMIGVGSGTSGAGGKLVFAGGRSTAKTGGALVLASGEGMRFCWGAERRRLGAAAAWS